MTPNQHIFSLTNTDQLSILRTPFNTKSIYSCFHSNPKRKNFRSFNHQPPTPINPFRRPSNLDSIFDYWFHHFFVNIDSIPNWMIIDSTLRSLTPNSSNKRLQKRNRNSKIVSSTQNHILYCSFSKHPNLDPSHIDLDQASDFSELNYWFKPVNRHFTVTNQNRFV